jgi:hypothetical protein
MEVPNHCNPIRGMTACGEPYCDGCQNGAPYGDGCQQGQPMPIVTDGAVLPGGTGYDPSTTVTDEHDGEMVPSTTAPETVPATPEELQLPPGEPQQQGDERPDSTYYQPTQQSPLSGHYSPPRQPVFVRNASSPQYPQPQATTDAAPAAENGLIGPIGYDLQ